MKTPSILFFIINALLISGCSRQQAPAQPNASFTKLATPVSNGVPEVLSNNMRFIKKIPQKSKSPSIHQQACDLLQVSLALRDAARGKVHKITPLATGDILQIGEIKAHYALKTQSAHATLSRLETIIHGEAIENSHHITISSTTPIQDPLPLETTLRITPVVDAEVFSTEFLEAAYDTIETGYASNEISLTLSNGTQTTTLCRRGSMSRMWVTLEPQKIEFSLDGYGLDPQTFLSVVLGLPRAATLTSPTQEKIMPKKVLFVLMPRDFQDIEFSVPYNALVKAGYKATIAGLSSGPCIGSAGMTVKPDGLLSTMTPQDFDQYAAIVISGGYGSPTFLWENEEVQAVVRYFHEHKKLVATICWACVVPARAGILKNLKATVYPTDDARQIFLDNKVIFDDVLCVPLEQERIITAQSPQAVDLFVQNILQQLQSPVKENPHG